MMLMGPFEMYEVRALKADRGGEEVRKVASEDRSFKVGGKIRRNDLSFPRFLSSCLPWKLDGGSDSRKIQTFPFLQLSDPG